MLSCGIRSEFIFIGGGGVMHIGNNMHDMYSCSESAVEFASQANTIKQIITRPFRDRISYNETPLADRYTCTRLVIYGASNASALKSRDNRMLWAKWSPVFEHIIGEWRSWFDCAFVHLKPSWIRPNSVCVCVCECAVMMCILVL